MKRYLTHMSTIMEESTIHERRAFRNPEMRLVKAYPSVTYQRVVGFGAALTEASGYVFSLMSADLQKRFLDLCFGSDENAYSLARLSIQSCDFSLVPRSYLKRRNDSLEGFSIDDDWAYILPLVKAAQEVNPALEFMATPWSPPAWAKTNMMMKYGGHLKKNSYGIWARMIAQTLALYRDEGVNIGRISVQNEPQAVQTWESCLFNAEQECTFLHDHLKPALREAGLQHVKTLIWDHNKDGIIDRMLPFVSDERFAGDVDGIAFHWYSGDHFQALRAAREMAGPDRELIFSEGCDCYTAGDPTQELPHAEHYAREIIGDLEAGANGILDWNILLDEQGGPNHVGNFCDAPIMYDRTAGHLNVRLPFHYIGHFSRFIQPGAVRVLVSSYTTDLETCGFANPDGSLAIVILNRTDYTRGFDFTFTNAHGGTRVAKLEAPEHSIQTLVIPRRSACG